MAAASLLFTSSLAVAQYADIVIRNASVHTMDDARPAATAIAIVGERIRAVGSDRQVSLLIGQNTRVIDAERRVVIPGFNDSHVHFTSLGYKFSHLDLSGSSSTADVLERIKRFTQFLPAGRWLIGARLDVDAWPHRSLPSLTDLDSASPENPVFLYLKDNSRALVNSKALRASNVVATNTDGIVRRSNGEPTGELFGRALVGVRSSVPSGEANDWAAIAETASNYAASLGVTSVQDVHSDDIYDTLRGLAAFGRLKTRVYDCIGIDDWEKKRRAIGNPAAEGDPIVRRGCVKGVANGYEDEPGELRSSVQRAHAAGLQVLLHAIGGRANEVAVDVLGAVVNSSLRRDPRHRIEHAHNIRPKDVIKASRSRIILSMQPALFSAEGQGVGDDFLSMINSGNRLSFGSDASMIDIDPLLGVHAAVNNGRGSISVTDAVKAYTVGSAYAEFREKEKGSLVVGKLADIVMLSRNIFKIDRRSVRDARVLLTIVGGKVVYEKPAAR